MNFLILFVIFLTLCEEMVNLQTLTKKTPLSIYEYSFDLQSSATKTIFFLYALMRPTCPPISTRRITRAKLKCVQLVKSCDLRF